MHKISKQGEMGLIPLLFNIYKKEAVKLIRP